MEIKIAFSGIGGVGGYYGGKLAHFYRQSENIKIYFISRGENLEVISREGLKIQTLHEEIIVHPTLATHSPKDIGPVDYLFCTTKSYDLAGNLEEVRPLIGPSTVIIPLLNGANITEEIRRLVPGHQVWYGCVYIGARLSAPGTVSKFTEQDRLWFGDSEGDEPGRYLSFKSRRHTRPDLEKILSDLSECHPHFILRSKHRRSTRISSFRL